MNDRMLHWACDRGDLAVATELLNRSADMSVRDHEGMTAMDYATICENEEIIDLLVCGNELSVNLECQSVDSSERREKGGRNS